jgi:hypothetical protein
VWDSHRKQKICEKVGKAIGGIDENSTEGGLLSVINRPEAGTKSKGSQKRCRGQRIIWEVQESDQTVNEAAMEQALEIYCAAIVRDYLARKGREYNAVQSTERAA